MKRAILLTATLALAGTMMAQTPSVPPPPQATPATPAVPAKPRARTVQVYRTSSAGNSAYLGVDVRDVTSDRVAELKLKNDQGVEITMVDQDGPAGKAGLKEHDVVVSYNGQAVQSAEQLRRLIRETKPGVSVALGIMRDGQAQTLNVALADRDKMYARAMPKVYRMEQPNVMVHIPSVEMPTFVLSESSRRNGITVESLTSQLGEYFGVKNSEGVLVRSVEKGSKAEAAGLKAGDVILRLDNERVSDARDWSRLLRRHEAGTVKLGILRDRREQTLSMTLPEASSEESSFSIPVPDMEQFRVEMQRMGPEFAQQQAEIQARIAREFASHQKEMQKALRDAQRELQRSLREMDKDKEKAKDKAKTKDDDDE